MTEVGNVGNEGIKLENFRTALGACWTKKTLSYRKSVKCIFVAFLVWWTLNPALKKLAGTNAK